MATELQQNDQVDDSEDVRSWSGDFDPLADPEERRVLFATLDSFRCVKLYRGRQNM